MYKTKRSREEYFSSWEDDVLNGLTVDLQNQIYNRYCVKCDVFARDNFTCQNEHCKFEDSPNTLHHIKFQKNGGQDKLKNCVTICDACHKLFHRGREPLTFGGMTYNVHKTEKVNWKEICATGKEIRKDNKEYHNYQVSWKMIEMLLQFLERNYNDIIMDD